MKSLQLALGLVFFVHCGSSPSTNDGGADATTSDVSTNDVVVSDVVVTNDGGNDSGGACDGGGQVCSGKCVDTQNDSNHCGNCATVCTGVQSCVSGGCVSATFNDIATKSNWLSYDLKDADANLKAVSGGTFDGRYVYFAPYGSGLSGLIPRYDTQSNAFDAKTSWTTFDAAAQVKSTAAGFAGAVFDGRYVYFVPWYNVTVLRYDTTLPFSSPSSYATFDTTTVDAAAKGFTGAAFDGKYVYLAPWYASGNYSSIALQLDTTASFTTAGSWKEFDISQIDTTNGMGYMGCVFDGKYVDFVPLRRTNNVSNGLVVRYDTTATDFTANANWKPYDTTNVNAQARGYAGGAFDGKNVYLVPLNGISSRYDTTQQFDAPNSWQPFDTANVNANAAAFEFGGFDGKFVYFGPNSHTLVARFDSTSSAYDAGAAWGTFDVSTLTPAASALGTLVFDGRYMYFGPSNGGTVAVRFDAKSPAGMPAVMAARGGSFY